MNEEKTIDEKLKKIDEKVEWLASPEGIEYVNKKAEEYARKNRLTPQRLFRRFDI